jgi:hypothetical protein
MNYSKPEITSLASANLVIQGVHKSTIQQPDGSNPFQLTTGAYESDE